MNSNGSGQMNISNGEADDQWFWWSPGGVEIYVTFTQGQDLQNLQWSAVIINVDGSGKQPFAFGGNINWKP
jgi:hypothetical protein